VNEYWYMNSRERFLAACRCEPVDRPPLWIMRQAGRFLPEYRGLRAKYSFAEMVHTPELAAEVTMQPVARYGFDAAIVFSDILAVPEAMGMPYAFREEGGISMAWAVRSLGDAEKLVAAPEMLRTDLGYVADAMKIVRGRLDGETALLGFAGSPWTLACYMAEGGGAKNGAFTRALALADEAPLVFNALMEKLSEVVALHLNLQIEAGADAVQIFDSWAGAAPDERYTSLSLKWIQLVIARLPDSVPVIVYSKDKAHMAPDIARTEAHVVSIDHTVNLRTVADSLPPDVAVQGNLDPALMEDSPDAVREAARKLLGGMGGRRGHIVNLGHGIRPAARLDAVEALVDTVRNFR
jgi:uroporphyrinogen decarboxylase